MGELRERMKRDMEIRGFSPNTQQAYLRRMAALARYLGRSPDGVGLDEIQRYKLYLTRERKVAWGTFNQTAGALRFFYSVTCKKDWAIEQIPYHKAGRRLPVVLNQQEMQRLLEAVENLKHRAILMTLYAGGLRVSEVVRLRVSEHPKAATSGRWPGVIFGLNSTRLCVSGGVTWLTYCPIPDAGL